MWQEGELFDISSNVWQSFSSKQFHKDDVELEKKQLLSLQWFYCHLSTNHVVMLGMDLVVGHQLAADMLNMSVVSVSEEDERDAVVELMNCICGQLDRDHPANECFDLPRALARKEINVLLSRLKKLSDVTANVGGWLYIALFEADATKNLGVIA